MLPLQFAPDDLRNNREFLMAVVAQNGLLLHFVPDRIRANHEIIMAAIAQNPLDLPDDPLLTSRVISIINTPSIGD